MKTFAEWSQYYGYDVASAEAKADYSRYQEQLAFFKSLLDSEKTSKDDINQ